jgi:hypothetical protein
MMVSLTDYTSAISKESLMGKENIIRRFRLWLVEAYGSESRLTQIKLKRKAESSK